MDQPARAAGPTTERLNGRRWIPVPGKRKGSMGQACDMHGVATCPDQWGKTIEARSDRPEALRIRAKHLADAVVAEIDAPPVTVTQESAPGDNSHRFHVVLLLAGSGNFHWERGSFTLQPGEIMLLDITEPSQVESPFNSRLIRWSFPETLIAPFLPARDSCPVLHLRTDQGLMKVIAQHSLQLVQEADRLDCTAQRSLVAHLCGLLGLAVEAETRPRLSQRRGHRSFQRQRVLAYVEANICDPNCTAKRAAHDLGMSVRWLHVLLEDMAEGFADLVAHRRLERSLALLEDPSSSHLSITEIAFLSGFNDLSTFYRRFGERYGTTPGAVRRRKVLPTGCQPAEVAGHPAGRVEPSCAAR